MTAEEVREFVQAQAGGNLSARNHGISLEQALVPSQRISIIERSVRQGRVTDETLPVWLVGKEPSEEGYVIVMRETDRMFGLASQGFQTDKHPILTGWYGTLVSAFMGM
jgi:hypothetical protein